MSFVDSRIASLPQVYPGENAYFQAIAAPKIFVKMLG
jgi:hypothetical protein